MLLIQYRNKFLHITTTNLFGKIGLIFNIKVKSLNFKTLQIKGIKVQLNPNSFIRCNISLYLELNVIIYLFL